MLRLTATLLVLTIVTGCSSHRRPIVVVSGARLMEETSDATGVEIDLDITNANAKTLPIVVIEYSLGVDGATVFRGRWVPETIIRVGQTSITLPAVVPGPGEGRPGAYSVEGQLRYRQPGQLYETLYDLRLRRPKARITGRGAFGASAAP